MLLVAAIDAAGAHMRAFIEHRGQYRFWKPRFTLYLDLQFSNEERAIVLSRALQHYIFDLSPGYLASTESRHSRDTIALFQVGGLGLFLAGFATMLRVAFIGGSDALVLLMLGGGAWLFWYGIAALRRERAAHAKQITVGYLVNNPSIAVQTFDPAHATILEENLRKRLTKLKQFLTDTHELTTQRAFEF